MDRDTLRRLEMLNQLSLTESQKEDVLSFFSMKEKKFELLNTVDTSSEERMVHVMPVLTVVREDVVEKNFEREDLQKGAPDIDQGYWCVPKVVD